MNHHPNKENIEVGDRVILQDFSAEDWDGHDEDIHGNFFWVNGFDKFVGHELVVTQVDLDGLYCKVPRNTDLIHDVGEKINGGFNYYWVMKKTEMANFVPEELFEI